MISNHPRALSALVAAIAAASLSGCGSNGSSNGAGAASSVDVTSTSNSVLALNGGIGGKAPASYGGYGGGFELHKRAGTGDVKVLPSGVASAGFKSLSFTPNFGSNGVVVATNTIVSLYADCAAAASASSGSLYLVAGGNGNLYKSDGGTACEPAEIVTGLKVNSGATLTLPLNSGNWTYVDMSHDIQNLGAITTQDVDANSRGSLDLEGSSYIGSGKLLTKGLVAGQQGGDIYLSFDYALINSGEVNASGADSTAGNGGNAGYIELNGYYYVQNTGALNAKGGDSTSAAGQGGSGNDIELDAGYGPAYNKGAADARGGKGATGGDGADFDMYAYMGNLHNSGSIKTNGADSTLGNGGNGGDVYFRGEGGTVRNSGAVLAHGGKTADVAGNGGYGGDLDVYSDHAELYEYTPAGSITWSGRIALHGGDAVATGTGSGGGGGSVYAKVDDDQYTAKSEIAFVGYSRADTFGGTGTQGGNAGSYELYNYDSYVRGNYENVAALAGNIISKVAIKANGGAARADGAGASGQGGRGGDVYLETDYYATAQLTPAASKVTHAGAVDISGGQNRNANQPDWWNRGGQSGYLWVWGYNGVSWSGAVTANGGNDVATGTGSYGGIANDLEWYSELGLTKVAGNITSNGGNGNYVGGHARGVEVYGNKVAYSGTIKSNGGNANAGLAGSVGGDGGYVYLKATDPAASSVSGTAQYAGGTGTTAGNEGAFIRLISCAGKGC